MNVHKSLIFWAGNLSGGKLGTMQLAVIGSISQFENR